MVYSNDRTVIAMNSIFRLTSGGGCEPGSLEPNYSSTCLKASPAAKSVNQGSTATLAIEEVPGENTSLSGEDLEVVEHLRTLITGSHGCYVVGLPRRTPPLSLGKSRGTALRRYLSNER